MSEGVELKNRASQDGSRPSDGSGPAVKPGFFNKPKPTEEERRAAAIAAVAKLQAEKELQQKMAALTPEEQFRILQHQEATIKSLQEKQSSLSVQQQQQLLMRQQHQEIMQRQHERTKDLTPQEQQQLMYQAQAAQDLQMKQQQLQQGIQQGVLNPNGVISPTKQEVLHKQGKLIDPVTGQPVSPRTYQKRVDAFSTPAERAAFTAEMYNKMSWRQRFFGWRPLPWWSILILVIALFSDLRYRYHSSPCTVLGLPMWQPVTQSSIKKYFRTISMCTHPDRLIHTLKRQPSEAEALRGQMLFNRHTSARDGLVRHLEIKQKRKELRWARRNKNRKKKGLPELSEEEQPENEQGPVSASCSDLDATDWAQLWTEIKMLAEQIGVGDIFTFIWDTIYSHITLSAGIMNTVVLVLWLTFLWSTLKSLFGYVASAGFAAPLYILGSLIVGPLPTLSRFFGLPFLRFYVFIEEVLQEMKKFSGGSSDNEKSDKKKDDDAESDKEGNSLKKDSIGGSASSDGGGNDKEGKDKKDKKKLPKSTAHLVVASDNTTGNTKLRKRRVEKKKEESKEKDEAVIQKIIDGDSDGEEEDGSGTEDVNRPSGSAQNSGNMGAGGTIIDASFKSNAPSDNTDGALDLNDAGMPIVSRRDMGLMRALRLASKTPNRARTAVAAATQFDLLLPLTKPIIPLVMLILTGQVWSGLITSMVISHVLRNWLPKLNYETHHLVSFMFGFLHTILGVSAQQIESHAEAREGEAAKVKDTKLLLQWEWTFKDLVSLINMIMIGAFVSSLSSMGNEPSFCASFASGLGFRIFLSMPETIYLFRTIVNQLNPVYALTGIEISGVNGHTGMLWDDLTGKWSKFLYEDLKLVVSQSDDLLSNAGSGIGDCAGGFYRSFTGGNNEQLAMIFVIVVKMFLIVLPLLSACQWLWRAYTGSQGIFGQGGDSEDGNTGPKVVMTTTADGKQQIIRRGTNRPKRRMMRVCTRLFLGITGLIQCALMIYSTWNAANGGLLNLWIAFLAAALFESLLSLDDISGPFRHFLVAVIFIFI